MSMNGFNAVSVPSCNLETRDRKWCGNFIPIYQRFACLDMCVCVCISEFVCVCVYAYVSVYTPFCEYGHMGLCMRPFVFGGMWTENCRWVLATYALLKEGGL